ncbi:hypothetical protein BGZ82_010501 [Podila clonocystis]|nr:hypothetical protein BGZ82_010501 [Podila clonocystis]
MGHVVPTLASLKVVGLADSVKQTIKLVRAKIDYSLECIDKQLAKLQASSPADFINNEPRAAMTQHDLTNCLGNVEGLEGVELRHAIGKVQGVLELRMDLSQALSEALNSNSTLTTMDLWRNSIGDNGALALSETLKTNSTLATLDIRINGVSAPSAPIELFCKSKVARVELVLSVSDSARAPLAVIELRLQAQSAQRSVALEGF